MEDPVLFALAVLAILGTPGPTNTLLATAGAASGLRQSLPLVPAEAAGYSVSILTLGLVLRPVVAEVPGLAAVLRAAVGTYLFLLAVGLWRYSKVPVATGVAVRPVQVFFTTLMNPKGIVFALGVVPFGAKHVWLYLLGFLLLLVPVGVGWITVGALVGRIGSSRGRARIASRVGAAAVGTFAIMLIVGPLLR